jgi:glycosyltransferase involved in cell wall biosynthesis
MPLETDSREPVVSVICPVYDTPPALLQAAIASLLDQDRGRLVELILVDDGSRVQATLQAIREARASDSRIRVVETRTNLGPAGARNAAAKEARGSWIGFLDSDDLYAPDYVNRVLSAIGLAPESQWIVGKYATLHPDGSMQLMPCVLDDLECTRIGPDLVMLERMGATRQLIANNVLHVGATLIRRDLFRRLGGFLQGLRYGEDWLLFVRLSVVAPMHLMAGELYRLRRGHESTMQSPARLTAAYATAQRSARHDPLLMAFRRELRWSLYSTEKGLALNNLLAGRVLAATYFALRAWTRDPRELFELGQFLTLFLVPRHRRLAAGRSYSGAETFFLDGRVSGDASKAGSKDS